MNDVALNRDHPLRTSRGSSANRAGDGGLWDGHGPALPGVIDNEAKIGVHYAALARRRIEPRIFFSMSCVEGRRAIVSM
jgi:hypothetical protein